MPRDVAGNYTLPAGNPVVTNTLISSVWANTTLSDLATAMTNSLDRTGVAAGMTGQFKAAAGTGGNPGISFGLDLTSGIYRAAAGDYRFSVTTTDVFKFQAAAVTALVTFNAANIVVTGQFQAPDGTVAAPGYAFANELGSGLYRIGAGDVAVSILGVKWMEFKPGAANQVTVGGTVVAGTVVFLAQNLSTVDTQNCRLQANSGSTNAFVLATNENTVTAPITAGVTGPAIYLYTGQTIPLVFGTNNIARGQVDGNGRWVFNAPAITGQTAFTVNGIAGNNAMLINSGATAGSAFGLAITAGTNASDYLIQAKTKAGGNAFLLNGDLSFSIGYSGGGGTVNSLVNSDSAGNLNLGYGTANANNIIRITNGGAVTIGIGGNLTGAGGSQNVTINSVSSGVTLTLGKGSGAGTNPCLQCTGGAAGSAAIAINTCATTGAAALTPTWTNFPGAAGTKNPAHWLPILLDSSLHYIPCFQ